MTSWSITITFMPSWHDCSLVGLAAVFSGGNGPSSQFCEVRGKHLCLKKITDVFFTATRSLGFKENRNFLEINFSHFGLRRAQEKKFRWKKAPDSLIVFVSPVKLPWWRQTGHFVIQNGETLYKMMFLYVFVFFFKLCPKTDYHWSKKVDALQNGLARETQFHPKPSKSNVQKKNDQTSNYYKMTLLECSSIAKKLDSRNKQYDKRYFLVPSNILQNGVFSSTFKNWMVE